MTKLVCRILLLEIFFWVAVCASAQDRAAIAGAQTGAEKNYYLFAYFQDFELKSGDGYYMFFKNETRHPVKKYIAYATAKNAAGPYGKPSAPITGKWVEGPDAIKIGEQWLVYYDRFTKNKYGVVIFSDLKSWVKMDKMLKMPKDARHGSVLKISGQTLSRMQSE